MAVRPTVSLNRGRKMGETSSRKRDSLLGIENRGFTLVEVLVTLIILAIGFSALAALQVSSVKRTGFAKNASIATSLAQKKLEELKNSSFDSIVSNTDGVTEQAMTVAWTVQTFDTGSNAPPNRYKDVTVNVTWGEGEVESTSCYTIITEP
jgi:type IV pilus assembly protein PilV